MVKKIVVGIGILLAAFLGYCATLPDTFHVERAARIKASPEKIFSLINDYHNWTAWSPYEKRDPTMKRTYAGAPKGKGAKYAWEGNNEIGSGSMEITDSTRPSKVVINLDFTKPFQAHNIAEFSLKPNGDSSDVTWAMSGPNTYFCKIMHTFINIDDMCGKDFAAGLANLKAIAEK